MSEVTRAATPAPNPDEWYGAPTLAGEHVTLRALESADAASWLRTLGGDVDEVWAHLTVAAPRSSDDAEDIVATHLANVDARKEVAFTQLDNATGALAGMTTYYEINPAARALAIGWTWLGKQYWRTGINTESKLLLLRRAFDDLGAARVVWHVDIRNARSRAAVLRLGATEEGVLRKHRIRPNGTWRDTVQFSMTDDDWPAVRARLESAVRR